MITRFYVDNYKCLQNFEYKPGQFELIVGANGTGKTTVFEALDKIRRFVTGQSNARELFIPTNKTRWGSRSVQIFELDYAINNTEFQYRLEVNLGSNTCCVEKEVYKRSGELLLETIWEKPEINESSYNSSFAKEVNGFDLDGFHEGEFRVLPSSPFIGKISLADPNQSVLLIYSLVRTKMFLKSTSTSSIPPS